MSLVAYCQRASRAAELRQHGHAHGDAVGHLVEDHRVRAVGDFGRITLLGLPVGRLHETIVRKN